MQPLTNVLCLMSYEIPLTLLYSCFLSRYSWVREGPLYSCGLTFSSFIYCVSENGGWEEN